AAVLRGIDVSAMSRYPDIEIAALRQSLARAHRVGADRVVLGCGSRDILRMAAEAFAHGGRSVVAARPTCDAMTDPAPRVGARVVAVSLAHDWSHDLAGMLERVDATTGLVYVCNPHNPIASLTRRRDLEAFVRALPPSTHVLIDEAYHEYVGPTPD